MRAHPMKDLRRWPLVVAMVFAVAVAVLPAQTQTADDKDLESFTLSVERLKKSTDTNTAIAKLGASDASLIARLESDTEDRSITAMVRRLEREPKIVDALKSIGISARDYSLTMVAMFQTSMMAEMHTGDMTLPGTLGENITFFNTHQPEAKAFFDSAQKLSRPKQDL